MNRTYVMGFWPVAENKKNSLNHYSKYISLSLEMLSGKNLHFFSDSEQVMSSVKKKCDSVGINAYFEHMPIHALKKFQYMDILISRTKNFGQELSCCPSNFNFDKGLNHYWRDFRHSGEKSFKKVFSIWHSKIDLLRLVSLENRFDSRQFAWIDASISRFNNKRVCWDFRNVQMEQPQKIYHYPNIMRKNGQQLKINASFLLGDKKAVEQLQTSYDKAFEMCLGEDYPNDEETVLDEVISQTPGFFQEIRHSSYLTQTISKSHQTPTISKIKQRLQNHGLTPEKQKILVVGAFRSGTNAMKKCLEDYFSVEVTFNEWFWKHGIPPTGIQCPIPSTIPILIMCKSPVAFQESLYPFWQHRRRRLQSGQNISSFIRNEFLVYDNTNGDFVTPTYWYRSPTDYWNQFYFAWLSWNEVKSRCRIVRYEDFSTSPDEVLSEVARSFNLVRMRSDPVFLPEERVGPYVPTKREGMRYIINREDNDWIRRHTNAAVAKALRYET